ncbi:nuclear transport factor 2 family protein [Roseobacter sp. EG26]|uniref:nuclear transport factor 2 family protein n=1 Tax=Roseobacter sp. EG26 TaxID=3412477 RepID=UPI00262CDCE1|nr:nuclear transport factor 2 family protein [uncultured Roseobacter sp.]
MTKTLFTVVAILCATQVVAQERELPDLVRQATPDAVVQEHLDALNLCDWDRLMAQYPADAEIHLAGGTIISGRKDIGDLFAGFCQSVADGGLMGITFASEHVFPVGNTLNVQWVARADFLAEEYRGSDAYVTRDGLMAAMVTTFDGAALKMK